MVGIHEIHTMTWISAPKAFDKNLTSVLAFQKSVSKVSKEMNTSFTMKKSQKQIFNRKELEAFALKSRIRLSCTPPLIIPTLFWYFGPIDKSKNRKEKVYILENKEEKDTVNLYYEVHTAYLECTRD